MATNQNHILRLKFRRSPNSCLDQIGSTPVAGLPSLWVSSHVLSATHCSGRSDHIPGIHDVQKVGTDVSTWASDAASVCNRKYSHTNFLQLIWRYQKLIYNTKITKQTGL
jgi:hypothetical protein